MAPSRRSARNAPTPTSAARASTHPYTRANRQTSPASTQPSASIARPANGKTSLRLTVKAPPSKLRQATSGSQVDTPIPPNPYADNASESDATPAPAARTARSTRNPRTVVEPESEEDEGEGKDEDEEEEQEDGGDDEVEANEEQEDDVEEEEQELNVEEDSEEDAEGAEDEDEEMEDASDEHPPPPIIKIGQPIGQTKPNVTVTAPSEGPLQSVEDKEMEDDDEEELSELDSNENEEDDEEGEEDSDSDEDGSRSATPDLSKLTRRQRGAYEEADANLMALSNEAQKKKHLTAEEHAMRRAEMARRRKNLSEKRNEEEKMDTINKLLKKPAPKRRTRAEIIAAQHAGAMATPGAEDEEERPDPLFVRWVSNGQGSRLHVPQEWMDSAIGDVFRPSGGGGGRMVQEIRSGGGPRRMVEEIDEEPPTAPGRMVEEVRTGGGPRRMVEEIDEEPPAPRRMVEEV